ncbi:MAG: elongation factor [Candidatus Cloacimonetes bacterium HGW-Cloacimonetes-3]|nr:MAG: elongation factor [Candidatus Cloacimonetes bacterium HGW-Cloacimonetes-3]
MMYYMLKSTVNAEIKILRSQFIAMLYPVSNSEEARNALSEHTKRYADATHNCYAYLCGMNQETSYYADAGEPGGTAGKPILNAMLRHNLTNTLAVVTRYYGGIKLGVKGLIDAYGEAVEAAIAIAELIPAREYQEFVVSCDYHVFDSLKYKAQELEASISEIEYAVEICLVLSVPCEHVSRTLEFLDGYAQHSRLNYKQKTTKD